MTHVRLKLTIVGLGLAAAVTFLAVSGVRDGWVYYLPVDEFVASDKAHDRRVRLHGIVGEDRLVVSPANLSAEFVLLGETARIPVAYTGVVPDLFKAGNQVVAEGTLDEHGVFQADMLMTKCASKYESEDGEAPHTEPSAAGENS